MFTNEFKYLFCFFLLIAVIIGYLFLAIYSIFVAKYKGRATCFKSSSLLCLVLAIISFCSLALDNEKAFGDYKAEYQLEEISDDKYFIIKNNKVEVMISSKNKSKQNLILDEGIVKFVEDSDKFNEPTIVIKGLKFHDYMFYDEEEFPEHAVVYILKSDDQLN